MTYKLNEHAGNAVRVWILLVAALVLGFTFSSVPNAAAQTVIPPTTPAAITPPEGNRAFLVGHAFGTQGYVCLPASKPGDNPWAVNSARPEATLFTDILGLPFQIITHFLSPDARPNKFAPEPVPLGGNATWQSSLDSSRVWAAVTAQGGSIPAGSDPTSCPNSGSIPCLLLQSIGNQTGPTGGQFLANVTFIQRLNTKGGTVPTISCTVGQTQLVPYSADYYFYRAEE